MANDPLPGRRQFLLSSCAAFTLAGCGGLNLGPTDADAVIYLLEPKLPAPASGASPAAFSLAVAIPNAMDSLDSRRIALINADATLDYYANAAWPDRLPRLVQSALVSGFQASGRVPLVSRLQDAVQADYVLTADIRDCAAHYAGAGAAPQVTVALSFQLLNARGRRILVGGTASQNQAASADSIAAVVAAYNAALAEVVNQVVGWTLSQSLAVPPESPPR